VLWPLGGVRLPGWVSDGAVVVLGAVPELDEVDVAAVAIAAPPPATAAVTAIIANSGLNRGRM
jgi:hypothetical protein